MNTRMPAIQNPPVRRSATPPQRPPPPACVARRNHSESPSHDRPSSASSHRSTDSGGSRRSVRFDDVRQRQQRQRQNQQQRRRLSGSDISHVSNPQSRGRRQRPEITIISAQPMINHPAFANGDKGGYIPPEAPPSYEQAMRAPLPLNPTFTDPNIPDHISEVRRVFPEVQTINESRSSPTGHIIVPSYDSVVTSQTIQEANTVTSVTSSRTLSTPSTSNPQASGTSQTPTSRSRNINHCNNSTDTQRERGESRNTTSSVSTHTRLVGEISQSQTSTSSSSSVSDRDRRSTSSSTVASSGTKPAIPAKKPVLPPKPRTSLQRPVVTDSNCPSHSTSNNNNNSSKGATPKIYNDTPGTSSNNGRGHDNSAFPNVKLDRDIEVTVKRKTVKQYTRSQSQPDVLEHIPHTHHRNMSASMKPPVPASRANIDSLLIFEDGGSNGPSPLMPGTDSNGSSASGGLMSPLMPTPSIPQGGSISQDQGLLSPTLAPPLIPTSSDPVDVGIVAAATLNSSSGSLTLMSPSTNGPQGQQVGATSSVGSRISPKRSPQHTVQNGVSNGPIGPPSILSPQGRKLPPPPRPTCGPKKKKTNAVSTPSLLMTPTAVANSELSEGDFNDSGYASINYQQGAMAGSILTPKKPHGVQSQPPVLDTALARLPISATLISPMSVSQPDTTIPPPGVASTMPLSPSRAPLPGGSPVQQPLGGGMVPLTPTKVPSGTTGGSPPHQPTSTTAVQPGPCGKTAEHLAQGGASGPLPAHAPLGGASGPLSATQARVMPDGSPAHRPLEGAPGPLSATQARVTPDNSPAHRPVGGAPGPLPATQARVTPGSSPAHPPQGGASGPHSTQTSQARITPGSSPAHPPLGGILTPTKISDGAPAPMGVKQEISRPSGAAQPMGPMNMDLLMPQSPILAPQTGGIPKPVPRKTAIPSLDAAGPIPTSEPVYAAVAKKRTKAAGTGSVAETDPEQTEPTAGATLLDMFEPSRDQVVAAELEVAAPALPPTRPPLEDFEDLLSPADMDAALKERDRDKERNSGANPPPTDDLFNFDPFAPHAASKEDKTEHDETLTASKTVRVEDAINPVYESGNFLDNEKLPHIAHSSLSPALPPPRTKKKAAKTSSGASSDSSVGQEGAKSGPPLPKVRPTGAEGSIVIYDASEKREATSPEATLVLRQKKDEKEEAASFAKKMKRRSSKIKKSIFSVTQKKHDSSPKSGTQSDESDGKNIEKTSDETRHPKKQTPLAKPSVKPPRPSGPPPRPTHSPAAPPARPTALPVRASPSPIPKNKTPSTSVTSPIQPTPQLQTAPPKPASSPKVRPAKPPPPKLVPSRAAPVRPEPRKNVNQNNALKRLQTESPERNLMTESPPTTEKAAASPASMDLLLVDLPPTQNVPTPRPRSDSKTELKAPQAAMKPRPGPPARAAPGRPQVKPARPPPAAPGPKKLTPPSVQPMPLSPPKPRRTGKATTQQTSEVVPVPRGRTKSNPQTNQAKPVTEPQQSRENVPPSKVVPKARKTVPKHSATIEVVALFDFDGTADDELSFKTGDHFTVVSKVNDEWLQGKLGEKAGIFPKSFVKVVQPSGNPQKSNMAPRSVTENVDAETSLPLQKPSGPTKPATIQTTPNQGQPDQTWNDNPIAATVTERPSVNHPCTNADSEPQPTPNTTSPSEPHPPLDDEPVASPNTSSLGEETGVKSVDRCSRTTDHIQESDVTTGESDEIDSSLLPTDGEDHQTAEPQEGTKATPPLLKRSSTALFDFVGQDESELTFKQGDAITVTGSVNEEWLTGEHEGHSGMFPAAFVEDAATLEAAAANSESSALTNVTYESLVEEPVTSGSSSASSGGKFVEPMATATMDYVAPTSDEISFKVNDVLYLLEMVDLDWYMAQHDQTGAVGNVPISHITVIHPLPEGGNKMDWTW